MALCAAMNTFTSLFGTLQLARFPLASKQPLQAWDAADTYLLAQLAQDEALAPLLEPSLANLMPPATNKPQAQETMPRILVVNDSHGALSLSLAPHSQHLCHWGDSFLSEQGLHANAELNSLDIAQSISCLPSTESPKQQYDLVLIKLPKTMALLEHQLNNLGPCLHPGSHVIAAGMAKHIHNSTIALFEKTLGPSPTSKAWKKARLICPQLDTQSLKSKNPSEPLQYHQPELEIELVNYANVFSREKLDIGARFFIEQFTQLPKANRILDLGCGNGVLGIMTKRHQPDAAIDFIDESYMALASAEAGFKLNHPRNSDAMFYASDSLTNYPEDRQPDLILCNPPFHQGHAVGGDVAWRMFQQAKNRLAPQGELWLVANRHLDYHQKLKRLFGNCQLIASNRKFVVLRALN